MNRRKLGKKEGHQEEEEEEKKIAQEMFNEERSDDQGELVKHPPPITHLELYLGFANNFR